MDSTVALMKNPYRFISKQCRRYHSDLFETRLMLKKAICMTGPEAAELFYQPTLFIRNGAMPARIRKTLLGQGGVQGLDDAAHQHRKQMFMSIMNRKQIGNLVQRTAEEWEIQAGKWTSMDKVVLYNELQELLTRAVCDWAGVPLPEAAVLRRTREVTALFDYAGAVGPNHWWSRLARKRTDRWMADIISRIRFGQPQPNNQSPAQVVAWHRDLNGELLSPQVAAVELCNLIRPTVAIAVYITFLAHALHQHPEHRQKLKSDDKPYGEWFVQEVRRFYPFFPAVAARVRKDFEWRGYQFDQGRLVVLDLYGTNHDARSWEAPEEFWPERFQHWEGSPFNFIPQGGGDHNVTHRCAGEWITIELMKVALDFLTRRITYDVPEQDLGIAWSRLPAIPHSRFIIRNVAIAPSA